MIKSLKNEQEKSNYLHNFYFLKKGNKLFSKKKDAKTNFKNLKYN